MYNRKHPLTKKSLGGGKKGFTITELVIVIAVIAILAATLIPTFAGIITSAKKTTAAENAESALKEFYYETLSTLPDGTIIESGDYYLTVTNGTVTKDDCEDISSSAIDLTSGYVQYLWAEDGDSALAEVKIYISSSKITQSLAQSIAQNTAANFNAANEYYTAKYVGVEYSGTVSGVSKKLTANTIAEGTGAKSYYYYYVSGSKLISVTSPKLSAFYKDDVSYSGMIVYYDIADKDVEINITTLVSEGTLSATTYTANQELYSGADGTSVIVTAESSESVTVDSKSKELNGNTYTNRLKLNGAGKKESQSLKINVTGACTITVYAMSAKASVTRKLALYGPVYNTLEDTQSCTGTDLAKFTYSINANGIYYIAGSDGAMNVYYLKIEYATTDNGERTVINAFDISELESAIQSRTTLKDDTQLADTDFTGANEFLTLKQTWQWNKYKSIDDGVMELRGQALSVTFTGTGTISIVVGSTDSNNTSSIALIDESGNYVTGTLSTENNTTSESTDKGCYYTVTNKTFVTVTFNISSAGTYKIATNVGNEGRGARISSIIMTDTYSFIN